MVFLKALDMSKTKIIKPSADVIAIMMQREWMPATAAYETTKSTPSSMDYLSVHVL